MTHEMPEPVFGELQPALDAEWQEATQINLTGTRAEYEKLAAIDVVKAEDIDGMMHVKEETLASMDPWERAAYVLNNFNAWWPDGWYRTIKTNERVEADKRARNLKLIADLDEVIREKGYEDIASDVAAQRGDREARLRAQVEVYLALRERGYARSDLMG